jgi:RNA polymerase sigma-70 factor, ECF subfamily
MFTKEFFLYFGVIPWTSGRISGISASHPLEASGDGCGRGVAASDDVISALDDQDPSLILIDKILAGIDVEESSRKLYELHYRKVLNFFRRKGCSPEDSSDLTQDVFSRVFKAIDTFRRESRFERWLFEIATNAFRNYLRGRGADKRDAVELSIDVSVEDESAQRVPELAAEEANPLESMIEKERRAKLRAALEGLPPQMRTCCLLRYKKGLKYQEIATVMKISIETVKAHLHQARKRLIDLLGDEEGKPS